MSRDFHIMPGRVWGEKDDVIFFDTDAYPLQYLPQGDTIALTDQTITFPDVLKANAYGFARGILGGNLNVSAISAITMAPQEWGPSSPSFPPTSGCELDDILLGTVPAGTDHIRVRTKLTRTTDPTSTINSNAIPVHFQEDAWVECPGGSLVVEWLAPLARMIHIWADFDNPNLDGSFNVYLTRKQSVKRAKQSFYRSDNASNNSGWTYGGTYGSAYCVPVSQRAVTGPHMVIVGDGSSYQRGGGNAVATSDNTDYAVEYTGDIEIIPGVSRITPESAGAGAGGKYLAYCDMVSANYNSNTHTASSVYIGEEPRDGETRHVVVAFQGSAILGYNGARDLTSITIGGTTIARASLPGYARFHIDASGSNDHNYVSGVALLEVPTGTTANIVLNWGSQTFQQSSIDVFAIYNLDSETPDAVVAMPNGLTSYSLPTADNGFAFAIMCGDWPASNYGDILITGIDNVQMRQTDAVSIINMIGRGFQMTTGDTLSLYVDANRYTGQDMAMIGVSFH